MFRLFEQAVAVTAPLGGVARDHGGPRAAESVRGVTSVIADVQRLIDRLLASRRRVRVLEAGCGSCTHFDLGGRAFVVGVDISRRQLAMNPHLDRAICADLETCDLPAGRFDLVVCWYVLEHLRRPQDAVARLVAALAPGGLLVLAVPCVGSFKGLVTRLTPHWFHVLFYRRLLGRDDAGADGRPPFRTFLRWAIRPSALRRAAGAAGLSIDMLETFEDYSQRALRIGHPRVRVLYEVAETALRALSRGRLSVYRTDCVMVLRRSVSPDRARERDGVQREGVRLAVGA